MSHPVDVHVGQKLKSLRLSRGQTQTEIAVGLGISFQQVQKYELGRNRISASKLFEISRILDVSPAYFFDGLEGEVAENKAPDQEVTEIASMLTQIKNERLRSQIRTFISELAASGANGN